MGEGEEGSGDEGGVGKDKGRIAVRRSEVNEGRREVG